MQHICYLIPFPDRITFLVGTNCNAQIFRNKLTFFAAAKVSSSFPPPDMPEIAFAGRYLKFCTCSVLSQILDTLTCSSSKSNLHLWLFQLYLICLLLFV